MFFDDCKDGSLEVARAAAHEAKLRLDIAAAVYTRAAARVAALESKQTRPLGCGDTQMMCGEPRAQAGERK